MRISLCHADRPARGFVLLEVLVALVILGVSVATIMRSFQLSLSAIRKCDVSNQACVLAEKLIQELDRDPAKARTGRGTFEEDGLPNYSWEVKVEDEEVRYPHVKLKNKVDYKPLRHVEVSVIYDDKRLRKFVPVHVELYLMPIERYTYNTKFYNELFLEEVKR